MEEKIAMDILVRTGYVSLSNSDRFVSVFHKNNRFEFHEHDGVEPCYQRDEALALKKIKGYINKGLTLD